MKSPINRFLPATIVLSSAAWLLPSCQVTAAPNQPPSPPVKSPTAAAQTAPVTVSMTNQVKGALPRALWVWDATVITDSKHGQDLFDFCAKKGISVIYLSVGDIFSPTQREASDPKHITAPKLAQFLKAAHAQKLEVEALDGDPSFALQPKHAATLQRLEKALDYNQTAASDEKLDGFQWDTEPYILDEFKAGGASQQSVLIQYLNSAAQMRDAVKKRPSLRLGYAIPSFFDDAARTISWRGVSKPAGFHLMDILNTLPAGYVAIMAYRDRALGTNGTVEISKAEVDYATQHAPKVKVWIGQETLDVTGDPPSITFYQEGENALEQALGQIQTAYKDKPVVAGLSIHHWASYRIMKPGDPVAAVAPTAPITEPLTLLTPVADATVERRMQATGTAKTGGEGVKVEVAVRPQGDIWYPQGEVPISDDGTWTLICRFGNDLTPAGRVFEVRAQLKKADGSVVTEQIHKVKTK